jgi:YVTN family beta-propeller protein
VVVEPSGARAYVTNIYGDDVAILDMEDLTLLDRVPVGDKPNGITFTSVTLQPRDDVSLTIAGADGQDPEDDAHDDEGHGAH